MGSVARLFGPASLELRSLAGDLEALAQDARAALELRRRARTVRRDHPLPISRRLARETAAAELELERLLTPAGLAAVRSAEAELERRVLFGDVGDVADVGILQAARVPYRHPPER